MSENLTRQEQKIFDLLLTGAIPKDIARELNISHNTVLNHQRSIYRKLGIHSIKELLVKYRQTNDSNLQEKEPPFPKTNRKPFPFKIAASIAAAVILALSIPLFVLALRSPVFGSKAQFVFTFIKNEDYPFIWEVDIHPDNFLYENDWQSSPFKLGSGNKINEGDTFLVTFHFISDTDLDRLYILLHDFTAFVKNDNLHDISNHCNFGSIKAKTEYKIERQLTATRNASSTAPEANVFSIYAGADTRPTIAFTKLEIEKINID